MSIAWVCIVSLWFVFFALHRRISSLCCVRDLVLVVVASLICFDVFAFFESFVENRSEAELGNRHLIDFHINVLSYLFSLALPLPCLCSASALPYFLLLLLCIWLILPSMCHCLCFALALLLLCHSLAFALPLPCLFLAFALPFQPSRAGKEASKKARNGRMQARKQATN